MKAAIYARKSTDDNDRHADNKSVTRQVEHAKDYARSRGWTVAEEHIYVDDGISGAEFRNRPALLRLLNQLHAFDVIVMSELSRLGREMTHTSTVLAQIRTAGVRVWFYMTEDELKFDSATDKFMVSALSFAAELEREKASQRSRDALLRKAERGFNTGGVVYGYDNVPVFMTGANGAEVKAHTDYRINAAQAEVVRAIFSMYADGHGMKAIARTLNGDPSYRQLGATYFAGRVPPPPSKGTGSWAPSTVREMLYRERYLGKVPFGQYRKVLRSGSRSREKQANYLVEDRPDLRIVAEDLWERVHSRLQGARSAYLGVTHGQRHGRPVSGRTSRYLLSGLMLCGCCNGSMVATTASLGSGSTRRREPHYLCSYRHNRGSTVCTNSRRARVDEVDTRVLEAVEKTILTPATISYVVDKVIDRLIEAHRTAPDRSKAIEAELQRLNRELERFVALIASGDAPQRIVDEIKRRETRSNDLQAELARLHQAQPTRLDINRLRHVALQRAKDLRSVLYADVPKGRQVLQQLLVAPLTFKADGLEYRLEGATRLAALFAPDPSVTRIRLASPRGFEPRLPP